MIRTYAAPRFMIFGSLINNLIISSEKKRPIRVAITPKIAAKIIELPATWLAFSF